MESTLELLQRTWQRQPVSPLSTVLIFLFWTLVVCGASCESKAPKKSETTSTSRRKTHIV
ncbi:hypothetical protein M885DRAFT_619876 [Pelagophyceae sp. CCMP2097]|nr:hypothetical protein M885DRAFT_619876 [Pelagophyceae sp. CCMP2097]